MERADIRSFEDNLLLSDNQVTNIYRIHLIDPMLGITKQVCDQFLLVAGSLSVPLSAVSDQRPKKSAWLLNMERTNMLAGEILQYSGLDRGIGKRFSVYVHTLTKKAIADKQKCVGHGR